MVERPAASLRLVTMNTGKGDGRYAERLPWLCAQLEALQADIVACQECFLTEDGQPDTAGAIAAALGMQLAFAPARHKRRPFGGREAPSWSGMALLARQPWDLVEVARLPADDRDGERICQVGALAWGSTQLVVANLHLSYLDGADALRREQLRAVLAQPLLKDGRAVRVLCGDFNTESGGPVLAPLLAGEWRVNARDCYVEGGGTEPRWAAPVPAVEGRCIDYVLSLAGERGHPEVLEAAVVLKERKPHSGVYASDHFGVAVTLVRPHRVGNCRRSAARAAPALPRCTGSSSVAERENRMTSAPSPQGRRALVAVVTGDAGERIQRWRQAHDPDEAKRLPPHTTLCYWAPIVEPALLERQVRHAFPAPVRVRLGEVKLFDNDQRTFYASVEETAQLDTARARLYDATFLALPGRTDWDWHVTCVRESRGRPLEPLLAAAHELPLDCDWWIERIAYLELRDRRYEAVAVWSLMTTEPVGLHG